MATRRWLWIVALLTACAGHRPPSEPFHVLVVDAADKSPLSGAIVTLSHPLGVVKETSLQTDMDGMAQFPVLRPGEGYKVRVIMSDYSDSEQEVRIELGAPVVLQVAMLPVLKEVVKVMGMTEVVDLAASQTSTTFGGEYIQDLPMPGRFYQNVLRLAPGVGEADGDGNPNVLGARERDFKALVSGVSNEDPLPGGFANIVSRPQGDADTGPPLPSSFLPVTEPGFTAAAEVATSTFGVDVDRASYALARRYLLEWRRRPPREAIRLEEMVNYLSYDYPDPPRGAPMAVYVDDAPVPWAPQHRLVRIGLQARRTDARRLPSSTLVFLVDVSGSMETPDRLPLVRSALAALTEELRPQDRVAIVMYADTAELLLPATPGDSKAEILDALDELEAAGGTAGANGLQLAYAIAEKSRRGGDNARVILATDGDFNVGPSTDGELVSLIEAFRAKRIALSVLGVGSGADFKTHRLELIADHGDGNYAYADTLLEARRALVEEMGGTLTTVARDVKVQVAFNPARVRAWRLLGYENRALAGADFEDDARDGGEMGAGHSVTAFYEIVPAEHEADGEAAADWMNVQVRWQPPSGGPSELILVPAVLGTDSTSPDFRLASAAAEFALLLRDSPHKGAASIETALARARDVVGEDAEGPGAELIALMEAFRTVAGP